MVEFIVEMYCTYSSDLYNSYLETNVSFQGCILFSITCLIIYYELFIWLSYHFTSFGKPKKMYFLSLNFFHHINFLNVSVPQLLPKIDKIQVTIYRNLPNYQCCRIYVYHLAVTKINLHNSVLVDFLPLLKWPGSFYKINIFIVDYT